MQYLRSSHNQGKKITQCKVHAKGKGKGNEEADKTSKQAIVMPGMTTRLPHTDYYLTISKARNFEWKREWENDTSKLHYIKLHIKKLESVNNSCR